MVLALSLVAGLTAPFVMLPPLHAAYVVPNGTTELSATPVNQTKAVPPNLAVTFDDSGSMNWNRLGDAPPWTTKPGGGLYFKTMDWGSGGNQGNGTSGGPWRCANVIDADNLVPSQAIRSLPMNGVYYNPDVLYTPPMYANGASFPNADATLSAVWIDGIAVNRPLSPASSTGTIGYNNNPDLDYPSTSARTKLTGTKTSTTDNRWQCGYASGSSPTGQSAYWNAASPMDGASHTLSDGTVVTYPNGGPYYYRLKKTVTVQVDSYGNPTNTGCTTANCDGLHTLYNASNWEAVPVANTNITIGGVTVNQYQNFANWYAYYRTRNQMARSSLSRVFGSSSLSHTTATGGYGNDIRVAWQNLYTSDAFTLQQNTIISALIDADPTGCANSPPSLGSQAILSGTVRTPPNCYRSDFFNWIFQVPATSGTPTRSAIARAGQFFQRGNGNTGVTGDLHDPYWQPPPNGAYSSTNPGNELYCRQNFTLLLTDGLWNGNGDGPKYSSLTLADAGTALPDGVTPPNPATAGVTSIYNPVHDGGDAGYASLSDIAYNYWATDLRPDLFDPTNSKYVSPYLPDTRTGLFGSAGNVSGGYGIAKNIPAEKYFNPNNDPASWPHMAFFMIGLGVSGQLNFSTNTDCTDTTTGNAQDACNLRKGVTNSLGITGWPTPDGSGSGIAANIDDSWHAGLAGRGAFFSAGNPQQLVDQLTSILSSISGRVGAATTAGVNASVATVGAISFSTSYDSLNWSSTFQAVTLNPDGTVNTTPLWSANFPAASSRNIYTDSFKGGIFTSFAFNTANVASLDASECSGPAPTDCSTVTTSAQGLQVPALSGANDTVANRINYLRGDATHEIDGTYRSRTDTTKVPPVRNVLGAIINSQPVYVAYPSSNYYDGWPSTSPESATGAQKYSAFVAAHAKRPGTAYVGANDGMLHAFSAPVPTCTSYNVTTGVCSAYNTGTNPGQEDWAFIPRAVYANLGNLTSVSNFQYQPTVDATPVTRDVFFSDNNWHTILAGGVGLGGRGVYALDITGGNDPTILPTQPDKVLWEFDADMPASSGCVSNYGSCVGTDMGYTVSQPNIARLNNGEWVVLVSNGYFPDCSKPDIPTATVAACQTIAAQAPKSGGNPYSALFVFDAQTGKMVAELKTPTGISGVTSFGLATPVLGDYNSDQIDDVAFAGDLQGNLWRFDLSDPNPQNWKVTLAYAGLADASGNQGLQPITTMPRLFPDPATGSFMVVFGTGKYLGAGDNSSNAVQGIYGIRDTGPCANPGTGGGCAVTQSQLVQQTLGEQTVNPPNPYQGATVRTDTNNPVPVSNAGWYIPLKIMDSTGTTQVNSGERVVVTPGAVFSSNMVIVQTLIAGAAGSDPCNPTTQGAVMVFNTNNGGPGTGVSSLGGAPVVGGRINNARTSGSLPVVSALGGGQFYIPGVTLSNAKNQGPFTGDSPIWRRRSWSEINQIQ
jgi:type IV pilus assembly protein PilY1